MTNNSIIIEPTPNPNALKFILEQNVKNSGKSSYRTPTECAHNPLATELFKLRGVDQIHFFENVVTISKFSYVEWDKLELEVMGTLTAHLHRHNPDYIDPDPKAEARAKMTPELQKIEDILDQSVRRGLQGDGGDVECLSFQDNILIIKYQGSCGTCPSSSAGTLQAITSILRDEFNPDIEVYIAPEASA